MSSIPVLLVAALVLAPSLTAAQTPAASSLDYEVFKTRVQPIFTAKRDGLVRCVQCHSRATGSGFTLQPFSPGATTWTEEQSRKNFESVRQLVSPGDPVASRLLMHPLARTAGGDSFHGGGKHWATQDAPEWQVLAGWVNARTAATAVRIIQTNGAGDNVHIIDPATNKVVGLIEGEEIVHGVTSAPDGSRIYLSNESLETFDVIDARTLKLTKRIELSGRPNNVAITRDGRKVYVAIAEAPGALDVIDTVSLTRVKTIPVNGAIHNVYVTPDGKFAVGGSIPASTINIVDTTTDTMVREIKMSAGIRPMIFDTNPDGSTRNIYVQLSNYHGFAVVDFASGKETRRIEHPAIPNEHPHTDGLQGAPAHGLGIPADGQTLWSTSKVYGHAYVYSLPDLKPLGTVFVGQHPEWITFTPDGRFAYIGAAGDNTTVAVDVKAMKVVAQIPVGQVPKRIGTAILQMQ